MNAPLSKTSTARPQAQVRHHEERDFNNMAVDVQKWIAPPME
jgi:hypothetical protein